MFHLFIVSVLLMPMHKDYPNKNLLLEPSDLAKSQGVIVIDARKKEEFEAGHVPGARHVDAAEWAKTFQDGKDVEAWSKKLGQLGLEPSSKVVIYDQGKYTDAARVWWILKYWGVQDVRLLHGMWWGWAMGKEKNPIEQSAATYQPTTFKPQVDANRLATKKDVLESLGSKSAGIVDARSKAEHTGEQKMSKRGGCIPGARNLDWVQLIDPATKRFKSADELTELFATNKIDLEGKQIAHCQGGGRSSVMAFAMELMGAKQVRNYHASWGEWGNSDDVPIDLPK